jgi:hypothetical protein
MGYECARNAREEGSKMKAKPCPLCGAIDPRVEQHGIACRLCGLWFGAGSGAVDLWRDLHCDSNRVVPKDTSWLVETWNHRAAPKGRE